MHSCKIPVSLQRLCTVDEMNDAPLALKHCLCEVCSAQVGSCLIGTLDGGVLEESQQEEKSHRARRSIVGSC